MNKFITIPNLPRSKIGLALIDYKTDMEIIESLNSLAIKVIKTVQCKELYSAIDGHPDILMHHIGEDLIVLSPNVYERMLPLFRKIGFTVIEGDAWLSRNYPQNIAYNVLRIGGYAFHNLKYTDGKIRKIYEQMGIKLVHVKQGYTKCSVSIIDEKTVITSDKGIAKVLVDYGIEVFLIEPGGIDLSDLNYGFIGGGTGLISPSELALTGNINEQKEQEKLIHFLDKKEINIRILSIKKITDIGSIIPLTY